MTITLNFGAHKMDQQKLLKTIYEKNKQAKERNEKIDLNLCGLKLDSTFILQLPLGQIATLNLSNCQLDDEAVTCLMEEIQQSASLPLRGLDLSNNPIGPKGAKALSEALAKLPQLKKLNLASNKQLNDQAVREILESLKGKSLQHLDLSHLNISEEATANAITDTKLCVEHFELNGCQFSEERSNRIRTILKEKGCGVAITTVFSPENKDTEYSNYKEKNRKANPARAMHINSPLCAKQQGPDTLPNNEPEIFSSIVQNC